MPSRNFGQYLYLADTATRTRYLYISMRTSPKRCHNTALDRTSAPALLFMRSNLDEQSSGGVLRSTGRDPGSGRPLRPQIVSYGPRGRPKG